ncbi:MAG: RNA polymerase factor sigma-54 [Ignavibacteriaceae bacterium]|nr:RNA polymerase factor sigma-54 [Ignavibacteriaceae bacterium]
MLSLSQKLLQTQKLTPQQILYQKLLQLNTLALEQRIKTELEINPMLDEVLDMDLKEEEYKEEVEITSNDEPAEESAESSSDDEFSVEDYLNDDDYYDPSEGKSSQSEEENFQPIAPQRVTLRERLLEQLHMYDFDEPLIILGEEIIGNLDEDGYLKLELKEIVEDLNTFQHLNINMTDAENVLGVIQTLEPAGLACRSLQECLLVQAKHSTFDEYYTFLAVEMLEKHFNLFMQKRYDLLKQKMNLSEDTLKVIIDLIHKLNPKPGEGNIDSAEMNQITPDFIVEREGDTFVITLNDKNMPSVVLSQTYLDMLKQNRGKKKISNREKEVHKFLRDKFESAKWFIASLAHRRETLLKVMRAIVEYQYEFFDKGPAFMKPLIYKTIASEIGIDISTISRIVNGKFVQSIQGIHELKYFFNEAITTDTGEEISNRQIKERIKEIIEGENKKKPLSDEEIAGIVNKEGVNIARRTVAKYRESLRLPIARLRKIA